MQIHALLWMGMYCFELSTSVFIVALDTPPCSVQLLDYESEARCTISKRNRTISSAVVIYSIAEELVAQIRFQKKLGHRDK